MRKMTILGILLIMPAVAWAGQRTYRRTAHFPPRPGSIQHQFPAPVIARGQVRRVVSRTVYFPGGPGSVVVYQARRGRGAYSGSRRSTLHYGKRFLSPFEMRALKNRYRFPNGRFGVHKTWTITTIRKQAF